MTRSTIFSNMSIWRQGRKSWLQALNFLPLDTMSSMSRNRVVMPRPSVPAVEGVQTMDRMVGDQCRKEEETMAESKKLTG